MPNRWKAIGRFALGIAEITIPGVNQIEQGIKDFRSKPSGDEKRQAVKNIVLGSLTAGEFAADRDLLDDPKVAAAYDGFISSYVSFQNALADAKAAKIQKPVSPASS